MDDCFKSMFAYTDCIPQVCDELIKSIFPRALGPSLMAELALTPAGDKGNSRGAAWQGGTSSSGRGCSCGFSRSPGKAEVTDLCHCCWHQWTAEITGDPGIPTEDGESLREIKACAEQLLRGCGGKYFLYSFRRHSCLIPLGIKISVFPALQDMNWKPAKEGYVPAWQFLFQLQQGGLDDCGKLFTDLSGCIFLLIDSSRHNIMGFGVLWVCLVSCVHVFCCFLLVWVFLFLSNAKWSLTDLFLSPGEAGVEKPCVA